MILPRKVRAVLVKELRDLLRDRRTIFANFVVPLLVYPVMVLLFSEAVQVAQTKRTKDTYRVAVEPPEMASFLTELAEQHRETETNGKESEKPPARLHEPPLKGVQMEELARESPKLEFTGVSDAEDLLRKGVVQVVLRLPADFRQAMANPLAGQDAQAQPPEIGILFDLAEHRSRDAKDEVEELLVRYRKEIVASRLEARGLNRAVIEPFKFKAPENVASAEKVGGGMMGSVLPLVFIMMILAGAIHPAIDLTAGEKERATMETLISAPVRPMEVIAGKFLAVATLALANAFLNVASFALTFYLFAAGSLPEFQLPWSALPATLLLLLPLTLFFAALLMAVASFAASFKEAQVYCLPVYMAPMFGLMIVIIPGIELEGALLVIPVVNTALLIKKLMLGHLGLGQAYAFVFGSTCLYAAATVAFSARIFAREEVLFGAPGSLRLFLSRKHFRPSPAPRPADALLVAALVFPVWFYFSMTVGRLAGAATLTAEGLLAQVVLPQVLVIAGLPLAAAWYLRCDLRGTFAWRGPSLRALAAGICLGASSWVLAIQFVAWQSRLWPMPGSHGMELERLLKQLPVGLLFVAFAAIPALCEEHLFRGFVLSGLRQGRGKWAPILISAAIFGAFHLPLFRQPVTMLMGVALGYLAWESRSLLPCMLFHLLHNGLSLLYAEAIVPQQETASGMVPMPEPAYVAASAVVFALGLLLARGSGPSAREAMEREARLNSSSLQSAAESSEGQSTSTR